ncbi:UNVERIFIED_CONTAM: hypothetical protein GTU68_022679 [Idotea baltica]|nr:hypothetical protein [Idotea baltica]
MKEIIEAYKDKKKMLGVCLGHQAIYEVFGGSLENLSKVFHGVQSEIKVLKSDSKLLAKLGETFQAGRYHSWVGTSDDIPEVLTITCEDESGQIMGFEHNTLPIYGVQFHPESILTPEGNQLLANFLNL